MATYNKLVRDRIPEIIEADGSRPVTRRLDDREFLLSLEVKLIEEFGEFLATPTAEELADILEVLRTIARSFDLDWDEVEATRMRKRDERGGFDERLFLEEVATVTDPADRSDGSAS